MGSVLSTLFTLTFGQIWMFEAIYDADLSESTPEQTSPVKENGFATKRSQRMREFPKFVEDDYEASLNSDLLRVPNTASPGSETLYVLRYNVTRKNSVLD